MTNFALFARRAGVLVTVVVFVGLGPAWASAKVLSTSGTANVSLNQRVSGQSNVVSDSATLDPNATKPAQVVVRQIASANDAAGLIAAQVAPPVASGERPEDFAINLALSSITPDIAHTAEGTVEQVREIVLEPNDVRGAAVGSTVSVRGRVFVDGALALFAGREASDLSNSAAGLRLIVTREVGEQKTTVFDGRLSLRGAAGGDAQPLTQGDFPQRGVFLTDLSAVDPELSAFWVLVFPDMQVSYMYDAVVGQAFKLRANLQVTAEGQPNDVGCAAIIGTPFQSLLDIVAASQGEAAARKMLTAMEREIDDPSGTPAFGPAFNPLLPACGLLGFECVAGLALLGGVRWLRRW